MYLKIFERNIIIKKSKVIDKNGQNLNQVEFVNIHRLSKQNKKNVLNK